MDNNNSQISADRFELVYMKSHIDRVTYLDGVASLKGSVSDLQDWIVSLAKAVPKDEYTLDNGNATALPAPTASLDRNSSHPTL